MSEILFYITSISVLVYLTISIFTHFGLGRHYPMTGQILPVTILIAARNEEELLASCLVSLSRQTYPRERLQVLVLNDRSTDRTAEIARDFCQRYDNFSCIDINADKNGLHGKMNVLAQGLKLASGNIILVTDADCQPAPDWVTHMCRFFSRDIGMVGGLTVINRNNKRPSLFDQIQTLDWLFLQAIASGMAGLGLPISVLGNNFGFRKSMYEQIGGFETIGFSLTEDMALLQAMLKKTNYRFIYPLYRESQIDSEAIDTFSDFIKQRRRWIAGGQKAPFAGWLLMVVSFMAHLMILISFLSLYAMPILYILIAFLFAVDLSLIWRLLHRINKSADLKYFFIYEVFYIFYTILFAFMMFFPVRIEWKGRDYQSKKKP